MRKTPAIPIYGRQSFFQKLASYKKKPGSLIMALLVMIATAFTLFIILYIIGYILAKGLPYITPSLFEWEYNSTNVSLMPALVTTVEMTFLSLVIAVPLGIFTAIYLVEYAKSGNRLVRVIRLTTETLSGIPSIIYGFFGLVVMVPIMRELFGGSGKSVLTASILLGIMILPTIVSVSESAIRAVPNSYYEGALALGASHERSVFFATLPAAKSGILAGIVLGIGRAIGETMAVIMSAGNQTELPGSIFEGVRTLTAKIVLEMGYAADLHREALIATAVVLFVFILLINLLLSLFRGRKEA